MTKIFGSYLGETGRPVRIRPFDIAAGSARTVEIQAELTMENLCTGKKYRMHRIWY